MKKPIVSRIVSLMTSAAICCSALAGLSGCGGTARNAEMAIVSANRQNSASLNPESASWIRDEMWEVVEQYGTLHYISVEGKPRKVGSKDFTPPDDALQLPSITRKNNLQQLEDAMALLSKVKAKTPEADVLEAIRVAAKSFSEKKGEKTLLICDSLLPTVGEASFAQGYFLNADPDVIVRQLEANRALPDLTGIDVIFCVAPTADAQTALSQKEQATLADIWTAIFEASGASSVRCVEKDCTGERDHADLPPVSAVTTIPSEGLNGGDFNGVKILDETKLSFLPDTTEFVDPEAAKDALQPIVKAMQSDRNLKIVIAGTTATVLSSADNCKGFSLRRAKAVKEAMVALDKSLSSRIAVRGLGYENMFHTPDLVEGSLIETEARKNRLVVIAAQNSDIGKQILS